MSELFFVLSMIIAQPFMTPGVVIQDHVREIAKTVSIMQQVQPDFLTGCKIDQIVGLTTSVVVIKGKCPAGEKMQDVRVGIDYKNHLWMRKWHTQESWN